MGMHCRDCQWYRPQWGECCFGGGWGHYPKPDDECERYTDDTERDNGINGNPHESQSPNRVKKLS